MKHTLQSQRGETIVEVLVSFLLLMIFTSMFVVSLRYARAMSQKAETLRETAYAFCAGLYPANNTAPSWEKGTLRRRQNSQTAARARTARHKRRTHPRGSGRKRRPDRLPTGGGPGAAGTAGAAGREILRLPMPPEPQRERLALSGRGFLPGL